MRPQHQTSLLIGTLTPTHHVDRHTMAEIDREEVEVKDEVKVKPKWIQMAALNVETQLTGSEIAHI